MARTKAQIKRLHRRREKKLKERKLHPTAPQLEESATKEGEKKAKPKRAPRRKKQGPPRSVKEESMPGPATGEVKEN